MVSDWVEFLWILEFSVVIFGGDVGSDGVGSSQESFHVNFVSDVGVKVILEVLKHVHVVVDEIVSSNSWESE